MALYAISDLHLSTFTDKPMDIFKGWSDYIYKIQTNWEMTIEEDDLVVVPGDFSWARNMEDALLDFKFLDEMKGRKILLKGNHDYWFSTATKVNNWLKENNLTSIEMLNNNSFMYKDIAIAGTRGWIMDNDDPLKIKVYNREVQRLNLSLKDAKAKDPKEIIVFLHYPPINNFFTQAEIIELLKEFGVKRCYYGHLHGQGIFNAVNKVINGISFRLLSADYLKFKPFLIEN